MENLYFGIEQELIFKNDKNEFLDFTNSSYSLFKKIVDKFPFYEGDEKYFHLKSTETNPKRCYIEGFEIHDENGNVIKTIPVALEIRTIPHSDIEELIKDFETSFSLIENLASKNKIYPVFVGYNPFRNKFFLEKEILEHEKKFRTTEEFEIAVKSMVTFGTHVNISNKKWNKNVLEGLVEKLNYYLPFIIPFSFSSPFYKGKEFEGYCCRNYIRATYIKSVEIREKNHQKYIEFKAFDTIKDKNLLKGLIYLLKGIILNENLQEKIEIQNSELIIKSSLYGFEDEFIKKEASKILKSISKILGGEKKYLYPLWDILETNKMPAFLMKKKFKETKDIMKAIL